VNRAISRILHADELVEAHFELHIEQGPRLEAEQQKIGVVHGVQAYRWHTIMVRGRDCHTGTTDFENRSDAMLAAAKMILHSHRVATRRSCLASTVSHISIVSQSLQWLE